MSLTDTEDWSRQFVLPLPRIDWQMLQQGPRPWLWLSGAHSETLEDEVQAITQRFDHRWVWRKTPLEYSVPGYRQGPLLVALNEALWTHAVDHWLRQQAALVLVGPDDGEALVHHLQRLHQFTASDGLPTSFSLHAVRQLEELCEGLPADRLSELFGPMQQLIWYVGNEQAGEWVSASAPLADPQPTLSRKPIALTVDDESALDHASLAWFMRDCARDFRQRFPEYDHPVNESALWRHLSIFASEARDQLALTTERDMRHYMALRFQYPHEFFTKDTTLQAILTKRETDGLQRLFDAEDRLAELASTHS